MLEARLLFQRLTARVDHLISDRRILRPGRHQAPAHRFDNGSVTVPNDHRNIFARRDVKAVLEQRQILRKMEANPEIGEFTGEKSRNVRTWSGSIYSVREKTVREEDDSRGYSGVIRPDRPLLPPGKLPST